MAKTHPRQGPAVRYTGGSLQMLLRDMPKASATAFAAYSPVVVTAGLVVEAADPVTAVTHIAFEAAVAGKLTVKCLPVIDGVEICLNFLATGGGNNALAAADLYAAAGFDMEKDATGWHAADSAAAASLRMVDLATDSGSVASGSADVWEPDKAEAGDVNARVWFKFLSTIVT